MYNNSQKEKIHRAGIVPYYLDGDEVYMLFMRPTIHPNQSYMLNKDKFQIAKGRIDDSDASTRAAALREAKEELGLWEGNVVDLSEVGVFMGRTTLFVAQIEDKSLFSTPDSMETAETKWMTLQEFEQEGRELHRNPVTTLYGFIKKHHGFAVAAVEVIETTKPTEENEDYDEYENPLALDRWGNKVNYHDKRRRR